MRQRGLREGRKRFRGAIAVFFQESLGNDAIVSLRDDRLTRLQRQVLDQRVPDLPEVARQLGVRWRPAPTPAHSGLHIFELRGESRSREWLLLTLFIDRRAKAISLHAQVGRGGSARRDSLSVSLARVARSEFDHEEAFQVPPLVYHLEPDLRDPGRREIPRGEAE